MKRSNAHQVHQLRKFESHLDSDLVCVVGHGSDQSVVVAQQVVVESLGVGVGLDQGEESGEAEEDWLRRHCFLPLLRLATTNNTNLFLIVSHLLCGLEQVQHLQRLITSSFFRIYSVIKHLLLFNCKCRFQYSVHDYHTSLIMIFTCMDLSVVHIVSSLCWLVDAAWWYDVISCISWVWVCVVLVMVYPALMLRWSHPSDCTGLGSGLIATHCVTLLSQLHSLTNLCLSITSLLLTIIITSLLLNIITACYIT